MKTPDTTGECQSPFLTSYGQVPATTHVEKRGGLDSDAGFLTAGAVSKALQLVDLESKSEMIPTELSSYSVYKPSGVEWLGDVPAHWGMKRLKALVTNVVDQTTQRYEHEIALALENVESWSGRYADAGPGMAFESQLKRFQTGDVLFGKLRPYLAKVTCPDKPGVCVGEFLVLRPHSKNVAPGFLQRVLCSKPMIDTINSSTFGAKMPRAEWQFVGNLVQPIPPLSEQTAIVRFLDHADRRIQRYIRAKQKLIALLEEQKQAVLHQAVTGQVDVRTGQPYPAYKPSGIEWLGAVPAHWEKKRLRSIARIRYGLGQPPREILDGLPLIRATNVDQGCIIEKNLMYVDPLDVPKNRDAFLSKGEIIVVRSGAYTADSAIVPEAYDGAVVGYDMIVTVSGAQPEFIANALLSDYVRDDQLITVSTRSAQPHLNAEELGTALFLLPPLPEQTVIVRYLDKVTADINTAISRARRQAELLQEYRTRLIADVVTGQLDVREAAAVLPKVDHLSVDDSPDNTPKASTEPELDGLNGNYILD